MRKLATLRRISEVKKHHNADKLAIYIIDGWQVIDQVGRYQEGDKIIYCEIDSFLPIRPEFEFLRKTSHRMMGVKEGYRLRTIRLRGELSQGLIIPITVLSADDQSMDFGSDVSEILGIEKYEPPVPENLSGEVKGLFPAYIPKTDEERVQNLDYDSLKKFSYTITEKLDGTSCTIFYSLDGFGVCSRNLEMVASEGSAYWNASKKHNLEQILKDSGRHLALQGELIGYRIQKNIYRLNETEFRVFRIYDIDAKKFMPFDEMIAWCNDQQILTVPIIDHNYLLPDNVQDLLASADGKSILNPEANREGIVFYANENRDTHFKVISNSFLESEED